MGIIAIFIWVWILLYSVLMVDTVQPDVGGQDTASDCGKPSSHHRVDLRLCHVLGWELGQRSRINDIEAEDERYVDG